MTPSSGTSRRWLIGALIAPSAPVLMALSAQVFGGAQLNLTEWSNVRFFATVLIGLYACSAIVGIPAYLFVRRKRFASWYAYAGIGFIAGVIVLPLGLLGLLMWVFVRRGTGDAVSAAGTIGALNWNLVLGSILGGLLFIPIGLLFWFIERPDQS